MDGQSDDLAADSLILVTGATGFVGSHVVEEAVRRGHRVRALVRPGSDLKLLQSLPMELSAGSLTESSTLPEALRGVTHVIHCAAKVGDWGPIEDYRATNVIGLKALIDAALASGTLKQFIHVSSLGVYEARDHYGTDESAPTNQAGIDGYTLTKVESEQLVQGAVANQGLPAVILRPGFIYGPRDRTVLPKLLERLKQGKVAYLGTGKQVLNNIYVGNLVDAIFQTLDRTDLRGEVFNLTDGCLASRIEFMETICRHAGLVPPSKHVPLPIAKGLAGVMERVWRLLGKKEAPLLSQARIKFLGYNLDFSIDRATKMLNYQPRVQFSEGMAETIAWARSTGLVSEGGVCDNPVDRPR